MWGYELLFRPTHGPSPDADTMTADVLIHAGLDLGLERLVGTKRVFVNASRPYLVGEREVPLPPERTVIEVLEDVVHDTELIDGCRRLREVGFTLALDDYEWRDGDDELLRMADVVKLDVLAIDAARLPGQVKRCSRYGARLVAEKVETAGLNRPIRSIREGAVLLGQRPPHEAARGAPDRERARPRPRTLVSAAQRVRDRSTVSAARSSS